MARERGQKERRKGSNIVVDSRALLRVSIPFLLLIVTNCAIMFLVNMRFTQISESLDVSNLEALKLLTKVSSDILSPLTWGVFGVSLLALIIWVLYSHRIFGPIVPIRRFIQGMTGGNFEGQLQLRTRDEFNEIANDLNKLSAALKNRQA